MRTLKRSVYWIGKWCGGFWLARRLTQPLLRILCYHGFELENETTFRPKLFIKKETFRRRLSTLYQHHYPILGLEEAIARLKSGSLPSNAVVITIDDGFWGVSSCAAPLLKQFGYPATIYVTTYYSQKNVPIFRLVVQYMFWSTRLSQVDLDCLGGIGLTTIALTDVDQKTQAEWAIINFGETFCTESERQELCRKLAVALQVEYSFLEKTRILSILNSQEISQLDRDGFDIQLHTHRHNFSEEDENLAKREIQDNRTVLEGIVARSLKHFCYPSGIWFPHQWAWLTDVGVESATTCEVGLNDRSTHPLGLKRFLDSETISQVEFEAEISGFAELVRKLFGRANA